MSNVHFEFKRIRDRDADGNILRAGATWRERTAVNYAYRFNAWAAMVMAIALIGAGLWLRGSFRYNYGFDDTLVLCGMMPGAVSLAFFLWPAPRKSLFFTPDGRIVQKFWKGLRSWRGINVSDIATIGAAPSQTWDISWVQRVNVVTFSGDTYCVADHLHAEYALKVAVELNLALKEIRAANMPVASSAKRIGPRLIE